MNTITREELKNKLENSGEFILLMCMSEEAYNLKHIPGSRCFNINGSFQCKFDKAEEIIVYCSGEDCRFSANAYNYLESNGYKNIFHYKGGLEDWEKAGYETEGFLKNN